uniref:Contactin 1 n=1 Tax=Gadus morhua TaxID=8049 RepID=A0A8C5CTK2_GADMO
MKGTLSLECIIIIIINTHPVPCNPHSPLSPRTHLHINIFIYALFIYFSVLLTQNNPSGMGISFSDGYGPVFEEQPVNTIYPEESPEARITMHCRARASPSATYRWMLDGVDIDVGADDHYSVVGGNLVIRNPARDKHLGKYSCIATNEYGTVISQQASVQFGYLDFFSSEEREAVYVKEGQGAVLLCAPPPHFPAELSFRWMLNEFPFFIPLDKRRFVSQTTGNLYISKVDRSDTGNYSCFVSSPSISKSVFSKFIPLVPLAERPIRKYPADINVKFPDTTALLGQNITLECFALGNPIPEIRWKKENDNLPPNHEVSMVGAHLHLFNVQFEDAGSYTCESRNSKGKDHHTARLSVEAFPEWQEHINSTEKDIHSDYTMTCLASGKPRPHVRWLKNGHPVSSIIKSELTVEDSGMYQCIADNHHGVLYANAELRVIVCAPTFDLSPVKTVLAAKNSRALIECRPKAAPKPHLFWSKGTELLHNSTRVWEDGTLEILNVSQDDEGSYTCFAENDQGKDNSTGSLTVKDQTKITLAPSNADVTVGEGTRMQCAASHDTSLEIAFVWSLNGRVIDLSEDSRSNGGLLIKDTQLNHAGRYTCMAETTVDNVSASAQLVVRGSPGPPIGLQTVSLKEQSVALQWSHGVDNHSPISKYTLQYRDAFSPEWRDAPTAPVDVEGNAETATVVDLSPWTQYDFRVMATNTLGTGEPSAPLLNVTTLASYPVVAPSDIRGGGGNSGELTITWTPVKPQYYYGDNFGYIIAFKPRNGTEWRKVTVSDPLERRYTHKDATIPPYTEFDVKVKAYNHHGEGPYSRLASVFSAPEAPSEAPTNVVGRPLYATDAVVGWDPVQQENVAGYQIKYWRKGEDSGQETKDTAVSSRENQTRLDGLKPDTLYFIEVRAYNVAGYGPPSEPVEINTNKAPPSKGPRITGKKFKGQQVNIQWEQVEPLVNESAVNFYKVLYRTQGQGATTLYTTFKKSIDLPLPKEGIVVEVRAHSDGGDGAVSQIHIIGNYGLEMRTMLNIGHVLD